MKIVIRREASGFYTVFFLAALVLLVGAWYYIAVLGRLDSGLILGALALFSGMVSIALSITPPMLVIDERGVLDERLGVGTILWSDIVHVHIEAQYRNRFLCLEVRNPEQYLARMRAPQRRKMSYQRELGFTRFNIDVSQVNLSLLDLKQQVELRMSYRSSPAFSRESVKSLVH